MGKQIIPARRDFNRWFQASTFPARVSVLQGSITVLFSSLFKRFLYVLFKFFQSSFGRSGLRCVSPFLIPTLIKNLKNLFVFTSFVNKIRQADRQTDNYLRSSRRHIQCLNASFIQKKRLYGFLLSLQNTFCLLQEITFNQISPWQGGGGGLTQCLLPLPNHDGVATRA